MMLCTYFALRGRRNISDIVNFSFGLSNGSNHLFYSSQITIGCGTHPLLPAGVSGLEGILRLYGCYREGKAFCTFPFQGREAAVGLCGDLWYDAVILIEIIQHTSQINRLIWLQLLPEFTIQTGETHQKFKKNEASLQRNIGYP